MSDFPEIIHLVHKNLQSKLPGEAAQRQMAVKGRPIAQSPGQSPRPAAVLISIYERNDSWHTVVIRRKEKENDRHSGQISFPGGKIERGESPQFAAIRESHEEIATPMDGPRIIGQLTPLHIPVSNFLVFPQVSYLPYAGEFQPQLSEVDKIIEVPLEQLMDTSIRRLADLSVHSGLTLRDVPCFEVQGRQIWGATAMILSEFLAVLEADSRVKSLISQTISRSVGH